MRALGRTTAQGVHPLEAFRHHLEDFSPLSHHRSRDFAPASNGYFF